MRNLLLKSFRNYNSLDYYTLIGAKTITTMTFSIMALSIMMLSIKAFRIMTFTVTITPSKMALNLGTIS